MVAIVAATKVCDVGKNVISSNSTENATLGLPWILSFTGYHMEDLGHVQRGEVGEDT